MGWANKRMERMSTVNSQRSMVNSQRDKETKRGRVKETKRGRDYPAWKAVL